MMAQIVDRKYLKAQMRELLSSAQVSPKAMAALYLLLSMAIGFLADLAGLAGGPLGTFAGILSNLLDMVLAAGFVLYCMAIRRSERAEYLTLFDGFSFVGKIILLNILIYLFVFLWSMLFVIPGIIAVYRYRFALYNLYENPGIGVMEALDMSKRQTLGYKGQLLMLDLSYLGWFILASLPLVIMESLLVQEVGPTDISGIYAIAAPESVASLPMWAWNLITGLWSIGVAMFYLPHYQCTELGYFEIAKSTSGVGEGVAPHQDQSSWRSGPDDLGGY